MNDKFDELAKSLAQSVTRRQALRRFGIGLAGVVLASLGLANKAEAASHPVVFNCDCFAYPNFGCDLRPPGKFKKCFEFCLSNCSGGSRTRV